MVSIERINDIAYDVKTSVEKNQKLPKRDDFTSKKYGYILAKSVLNPGKSIKSISLDTAPNPSGSYISRSVYKKDYQTIAKYFVNFIEKQGRLPNYVQWNNYKIHYKLCIYAFAKIIVYYNKNKRLPDYVNINSKVFSKPVIVSDDEVFNYFIKIFGAIKTFDEALNKIINRGYSYYYDDKYSNKNGIDRIKAGLGVNCTDSCHIFWHIAKALGYEVRCIHVRCSSGGGHVRLQIKHNTYTNGNWVNRDPAAVLSNNGKPITYIWCENGTKLATNPAWFLENVNR